MYKCNISNIPICTSRTNCKRGRAHILNVIVCAVFMRLGHASHEPRIV